MGSIRDYLEQHLPIGQVELDQQALAEMEQCMVLGRFIENILKGAGEAPFPNRVRAELVDQLGGEAEVKAKSSDVNVVEPAIAKVFADGDASVRASCFFSEFLLRIYATAAQEVGKQVADNEVRGVVTQVMGSILPHVNAQVVASLYRHSVSWVLDCFVQRLCPDASFPVSRLVGIEYRPDTNFATVIRYNDDRIEALESGASDTSEAALAGEPPAEE